MKAAASVYLNADRSAAVGEGDASARFLLVRKGAEISQKEAERFPGAVELIGGTKSAEDANLATGAEAQSRDPEDTQQRGPKNNGKPKH